MTIYIVENYYINPDFKAYRTLEAAQLGLLKEYTDNCLPSMIKDIREGKEVEGLTNSNQEDLNNIFKHGFVEDFAHIHECELEE